MTIESTKVAPQSVKTVEPSISPIADDVEKSVKSEVMKRLGKPSVDWNITAMNVFDNKWRVNVWINKTPDGIMKQMLIRHSYFISVSPDGKVSADVEIEKCYE